MNFEINNKQSFYQLIETICLKRQGGGVWQLNPVYGLGQVTFYEPQKGLNIFIMDVVFKNPILIRWNLEATLADEFYLYQNQVVKPSKNRSEEALLEPTIEEGVIFFSKGNERRRLWLPNASYKVCMVNFSYEWFCRMNEVIEVPENILSYLSTVKNAYLNIAYDANIHQIISQLTQNMFSQNRNYINAYLHNKSFEFALVVLNKALHDISTIKRQNNIHPNDLKSIVEMVNLFNERLESPPTMDDMAEELGMSKSKFQRTFKKVIGTTYYKFVLRTRMVKAMELLMKGNAVLQVGLDVGYSSIGNFTQAFKNYFGFLPSNVKGKAITKD